MTERIILNDDDVISMKEDIYFTDHTTSKVAEIKKALEEKIIYSYEGWVDIGKKCEILTTKGCGWVKGEVKIKINVSFEFTPKVKPRLPADLNPEVHLSDLREQLDL